MESSIMHSKLIITDRKVRKQSHKYDDISVAHRQVLIIYGDARVFQNVLFYTVRFFIFFGGSVKPSNLFFFLFLFCCLRGDTEVRIPVILSQGKSSYINHRQVHTALSHKCCLGVHVNL